MNFRRESTANKTTKFIHDYVEKVIDDLPAPIPLKPGDRVDESTNAVLLPQNWHNLSLKELMQFKIAPNIYPELVQQEEDPSLKWSKRRRLEEPAHGFKGRFKETAALYGKILTKLVPPCPATINAIELLEAKIRRLLLNCSLEPSLTRKCGDNGPETASTSANLPTVGSFAASSLFQRCIVPENVRHSSDYALLRKRIFRLFFLPLLMRRAIKTNEDEDGSVELT
uniref:Uncharacterized protein n=1 Tax=Globodera rostochiensis TaxID=31243 RepID=A0A914IBP5_GLORO